jgi:hypothetical protein
MSDDWVTGIKEGYRTKTIQVGNCTVRINRPILDDQERARREEQLRDALRGLIRKELENEH